MANPGVDFSIKSSSTIAMEYVCGMGAGLLSVVLTFPVSKIMFRQSVWGFDFQTAWRQLKIEGLGYLYRGIGPPLLIKPITSSIMFGTYKQYYQLFSGSSDNRFDIGSSMLAAMVSGLFEAMFSTPFERVQVILQDGRLNNQYQNMFHTFYQLRRYGLKEFYRGFTVSVLRNGPSTFLYFSSLNFSERFYRSSNQNEFFWKFLTGAVLGAGISTLVYPLNVIRTRVQIQPVGTKQMSIRLACEQLIQERIGSSRSLVAGIHVNMIRSFLHWGFITAFSDLIRRTKVINPKNQEIKNQLNK